MDNYREMDNNRTVYNMCVANEVRYSTVNVKPQSIETNSLNLKENWQNDQNIYMLLNAPNTSWTRNFNGTGANGFAEINVRQNDNPPQNQG